MKSSTSSFSIELSPTWHADGKSSLNLGEFVVFSCSQGGDDEVTMNHGVPERARVGA